MFIFRPSVELNIMTKKDALTFLMSIDKPSSSLLLALVIIPRYIDKHNDISGVAGHIITESFSFVANMGRP